VTGDIEKVSTYFSNILVDDKLPILRMFRVIQGLDGIGEVVESEQACYNLGNNHLLGVLAGLLNAGN
jgi:hypothetical protein